jgi:branched-chain amino acid transport system permease protein
MREVGFIRFLIYSALAAIVLLLPYYLSDSLLFMIVFVILTASLDIQYGQTGLISLAHGVFFGIGAYSCGIFQIQLQMNFWISSVCAVLLTTAISAVIGYPLLRTKGPYFALGSLAVAAITSIIIFNWVSLTGGYSLTGIQRPQPLNLPGIKIDFESNIIYYYLVVLFAFLTIFCVRRVISSRLGRAFIAIREDEDLAEALGVNLMGYKILAFSFSSLLASVGGCLYAAYMGAIEPGIAGHHMGFEILVMNIVGGPSTILGYIVGPFIVWIFPDFLGAAEVYRPLIFGAILVMVIIYMPNGVVGSIRKIHPSIANWIK